MKNDSHSHVPSHATYLYRSLSDELSRFRTTNANNAPSMRPKRTPFGRAQKLQSVQPSKATNQSQVTAMPDGSGTHEPEPVTSEGPRAPAPTRARTDPRGARRYESAAGP